MEYWSFGTWNYSSFEGNMAYFHGGALRLLRSIVLVDQCLFRNNSCHGTGGVVRAEVAGAGFHSNRSIYTGNSANLNGGIIDLQQNAKGFMMNDLVMGNEAGKGGALSIQTESVMQLIDTIISKNTGFYGGGMFLIYQARVNILQNTTVEDNVATGDGGGIFCSDSRVNITQSTVSKNTGPGGSSDLACDTFPLLTYCHVVGDEAWTNFCPVPSADDSTKNLPLIIFCIVFGTLSLLMCIGCMIALIFKSRKNRRLKAKDGQTNWSPLNQEEEGDFDHDTSIQQ